jgi:hypothetical protein
MAQASPDRVNDPSARSRAVRTPREEPPVMRTSRLLLASAGVVAVVATGSAFTDSNAMPTQNKSVAGYGETTATGATVTKVVYNPRDTDQTYLDNVVFTTSTDVHDKVTSMTLKKSNSPIAIGSKNYVGCTNSAFVPDPNPATGTMTITCTVDSNNIKFADFDSVGLTVVQQ